MRIVFLSDTADRVGGAERYLADLCTGLVEADHEVHVLTPDNDVVPSAARDSRQARKCSRVL